MWKLVLGEIRYMRRAVTASIGLLLLLAGIIVFERFSAKGAELAASLPKNLPLLVAFYLPLFLSSTWRAREQREHRMRQVGLLPVTFREIARARTILSVLISLPTALALLIFAAVEDAPIQWNLGIFLIAFIVMVMFLTSLNARLRVTGQTLFGSHVMIVLAGFVLIAALFVARIVNHTAPESLVNTPIAVAMVVFAWIVGWRSELSVIRGESLE